MTYVKIVNRWLIKNKAKIKFMFIYYCLLFYSHSHVIHYLVDNIFEEMRPVFSNQTFPVYLPESIKMNLGTCKSPCLVVYQTVTGCYLLASGQDSCWPPSSCLVSSTGGKNAGHVGQVCTVGNMCTCVSSFCCPQTVHKVFLKGHAK